MSLLKERDRQELIQRFEELQTPVKLIVFTAEEDCEYCEDTRLIVEELTGLSDKIALEMFDLQTHAEIAEAFKIDKAPATVVMRGGDRPKDYGIRFYGVPSGYEFSSLIEDTILASAGDSRLSPETREWIAGLTTPVHFQVFVTPTCPYCPRAVVLAHQMAIESDFITADMVEATEFPHLSMQYEVRGVPRTVINEDVHIEGAVPEQMLLDRLRQAVLVSA
jgi:glutaredoxin-like protein